MDLLNEIRSKLDALARNTESVDGIRAAIRHIEAAERWFERGRTERDEELFNDVVYRSNQAFEGMLKEAFVAMTDEEGHHLSPFQIEQHLIDHSVLSSRVLELFTNYRKKWRNPSTHDHRIFFKEQEALMAIVTVSAFSNILLEEIIEAATASQARESLAARREGLRTQLSVAADEDLVARIAKLLELFSAELGDGDDDWGQLREAELLGRLTAFIESVAPDICVEREPVSPGKHEYRTDLALSANGDRVLVELKASARHVEAIEHGEFQVFLLLEAFGVRDGILFIPSFGREDPVDCSRAPYQAANGKQYYVHTVAPRTLLKEQTELKEGRMESGPWISANGDSTNE